MKKVIYSMLFIFIVGVIGTLVSVSASGGFSLETYSVGDSITINNKDISRIEMDLSSTDLTIHPTENEDITVEFTGKISKKLREKLKLNVQEKGNTLIVGLKGEDQIKLNIGVLIVDTNVEVFIPERLYESIQVNNSSGDIEIQDLKAQEFIFETSSGTIIAKNLEATDYLLHTSSGDIELSRLVGRVSAEASSGDIMIENELATGDINAKTSSGDITVEYRNEPTSLALDFRASSGEGILELEGFNYEVQTENEVRGLIGSGQFKLEAVTSSGDFYLR